MSSVDSTAGSSTFRTLHRMANDTEHNNADSVEVMSYVVTVTCGVASAALLPQTPLRFRAVDRTYSVYSVRGAVRYQEYRDLNGNLLVGVYPFPTLEAAKQWAEADDRQLAALHRHSVNGRTI
jgi:hypothetical protein